MLSVTTALRSLDPLRIAAIPGVTLDVVVTEVAVVASPLPSELQQIAQQAVQLPKYYPELTHNPGSSLSSTTEKGLPSRDLSHKDIEEWLVRKTFFNALMKHHQVVTMLIESHDTFYDLFLASFWLHRVKTAAENVSFFGSNYTPTICSEVPSTAGPSFVPLIVPTESEAGRYTSSYLIFCFPPSNF
jgi:hypothetical protein